MRIKEIVVNHYGPLRDISLAPAGGLQVVFGPNESGKTLLIDALLKLMLGDGLKDFEHIDRVQGLPAGRVVVHWQGRELILDGNTKLDRETDLSAPHLRNVFVIRNKDLQLNDQASYFHKLNDQLTGVETRRLEQLRMLIQQQAALTNPTSEARLSKSDKHNKLAERVETARQLAADIRQYAEAAREQQLDKLELDLEQAKTQLAQVEQQISEQQQAEEFNRHQTIGGRVALQQKLAKQAQELAPFTREAERELITLDHRLQTTRHEIDALQQELASEREQRKHLAEELEQARTQLSLLENKHSGIQQLALAVEGAGHRASFSLKPLLALALLAAAAGLAWMARLGENDLLSPLPWICTAAALWLIIDEVRCRKGEARLLRRGAMLGISAQTLRELAVAVDQRRGQLETQKEKTRHLDSSCKQQLESCNKLEKAIARKGELATNLLQQLDTRLRAAKVESVEAFSKQVELAEQARSKLREVEQRLAEELGEKPADRDWQEVFASREHPADPGISYQPGLLDQLRQQQDQLRQQCDQLREMLLDHNNKLAEFAASCRELAVEKELGLELPRHFPGLDILVYAGDTLVKFADQVQNRYQAACLAIKLLENIEREERAQMAKLLGPDKPVQQLFSAISNQRYVQVELNQNLDVVVHRQDGVVLAAKNLSQGTYDQLYLALRLSLAQDILDGNPGFLILDDALLCADATRRDRMLDVLADLADREWQILYFTMDEQLAGKAAARTVNSAITLPPLP